MFEKHEIKFMEYYLKCSDHEWKKHLFSGEGLFKVLYPFPPRNIIGPRFVSNGSIQGDVFSMESIAFEQKASEPQKRFYNLLLNNNPVRAKHYLLVVINGLKLWKKDIDALRTLLHHMKKGESELRKEERDIIDHFTADGILSHIPRALMKHLPHIFERISADCQSFEKMVADVEAAVRELHNDENIIETYLHDRKKDTPFLF